MNQAAIIGAIGEKAAVKYLRQNGFIIRELNWRSGIYELDIIAEKWGVIHFVEVKSRQKGGLTRPEEAFTRHKRSSLKHATRAYVAIYRIKEEYQHDLIAIDMEGDTPVEIRHHEDVM
ncbi:MAG: YraN family protein [Rikenellaceae bacterium]